MNNGKSWDDVAARIRAIEFDEQFDVIVAIANGGIVPAAMLNQRLLLPIELLKLSFRNDRQQPIYDAPKLIADIQFNIKGKKVLLVEDRVKTGATLQYAKKLMGEAGMVKTFAVNGKADYSLFDEACFRFPWNI